MISEDYETVREALSIRSLESPKYMNFQMNLAKMKKKYSRDNSGNFILKMYSELSEANQRIPNTTDWVSTNIVFDEVFDLIEDEQFPTFKFKEHIIIFGQFSRFGAWSDQILSTLALPISYPSVASTHRDQ